MKRRRMRSSEARKFIELVTWKNPKLGRLLLNENASLEVLEGGKRSPGKIYLKDGAPVLVELASGEYVPYVEALDRTEMELPRIMVDMGAVPHIANGADVMCPGIVGTAGEIGEGDLVVVVDERYGRVIAVGKALKSIEVRGKGKAVKNLHHSGDRIWKAVREAIKA